MSYSLFAALEDEEEDELAESEVVAAFSVDFVSVDLLSPDLLSPSAEAFIDEPGLDFEA